jgi:hypothetical protein
MREGIDCTDEVSLRLECFAHALPASARSRCQSASLSDPAAFLPSVSFATAPAVAISNSSTSASRRHATDAEVGADAWGEELLENGFFVFIV